MSKDTEAKEEKVKEPGIGDIIREAIREGKTNAEALEIVLGLKPDANTTLASVNWYRNKLRKMGEDIPTSRDLKKAAAEAEVAPATETTEDFD